MDSLSYLATEEEVQAAQEKLEQAEADLDIVEDIHEEAVAEAPAVNEEAMSGENVPESIGLNELAVLAQVVDLATQRGAFRANELTQVGQVYDKLNAFLTFIREQQEANAEAEGEAESESAGE